MIFHGHRISFVGVGHLQIPCEPNSGIKTPLSLTPGIGQSSGAWSVTGLSPPHAATPTGFPPLSSLPACRVVDPFGRLMRLSKGNRARHLLFQPLLAE